MKTDSPVIYPPFELPRLYGRPRRVLIVGVGVICFPIEIYSSGASLRYRLYSEGARKQLADDVGASLYPLREGDERAITLELAPAAPQQILLVPS